MKLSDYVISYIESQGVHVIFGYIGGMITHLVDSIALNPNMQFVQTYHEQTAAIAAEGFAKESGLFGVAISTSGPGATNMMTGIADAYFDSIPVLYITGQVNTYEYKYDKPVRQQGFQETDVVSMVKPITKYAKLVDKAEDIKYELGKALHIAFSGRMGPVLLDLPMDIQRAEVDPEALIEYIAEREVDSIIDWKCLQQLVNESHRPMLLLGSGARTSLSLVQEFVERVKIPFVTSLMGKGLLGEEKCDNYLGMIGSYGNRCANMAIGNADLLIALGTRLDTRQTGTMLNEFLKKGTIIHVDIDSKELEYHRLSNRIVVKSSISSFLKQERLNKLCFADITDWRSYLQVLKERYNQDREIERFVDNKSPYYLMQALNLRMQSEDIVCTDIGQNQMWAAQTLCLKQNQRFVTSGGLAPMGFSLPAAIGCSFANPKKRVYSISGDGGFHMSVQSLMLISQYNLPVKVIVLNNNALGMITQFQHLYFESRMSATTPAGGYLVPDIKSLAQAYNLKYFRMDVSTVNNMELWDEINTFRNCIVEYIIEGTTTVYPKLEFNKPISQPMPLLSTEEYKRNMLS